MNASELRQLQQPLKEKYKEQPETAIVTLTAKSTLGEGISCKVDTGKAIAEAGLHPATLKAVAIAIEFDLQDAHITAEGDLDFRGTLGVDKSASVGFQSIRLKIDLNTSEDEERIASLLKLTERYCVVYQTLKQANDISVVLT